MRALPLLLALAVLTSAHADAKKARWQTLPLPPAMPAARSSGMVDVADGARIYWARYGRADSKAPPIVLLHGGLGNADHFALQLPALVDKFDVLVLDARGQGRSTSSKATISYDLMAKDVVAVLDALTIPKASFVGWSDGGEVAMKLGIHSADRVERLVVLGSNYDAHGSKPRGSRTATFIAYSAKCKADFAKLSKRGYDVLVDSLLPLWRKPMGFTKDQLKSIKAPTLVADGDHDEVIELAQVKEMATLIPNGKLLVVENASHFVMWQAPAELNAALVEFLAATKQGDPK